MKARVSKPPKTLDEIRKMLRQEMSRLQKECSVRTLEVFGSFVRGEASPSSDLDLLVEFENAPTLFSFVRLEDELSQLLGVKVDLVMKDGLKPALGAQILAEAIAI